MAGFNKHTFFIKVALRLLSIAVILFGLNACLDEDQLFCTEEWRSIVVEIPGANFSDYFTIRVSTGDTLRFESEFVSQNPSFFTVLDDSFQPKLERKRETFRFVGIRQGQIIVNEPYVISADRCHIQFVSGRIFISLN